MCLQVAGDPIEAAALRAIKWEVIERNNAPTEARPTVRHRLTKPLI
jgi:hypothetical protein